MVNVEVNNKAINIEIKVAQYSAKALIDSVMSWAKEKGYEFLQVKTLDESHPDVHYSGTRKFYLSVGFRPLECLPELWGKENPCLIMIKHIG